MTRHTELLHKFSSALWLILVLTMAGYTSYALLENKHIQFDLLALLPESENKHTKAAQQFLDHSNASEKVIILIGGKDSEKAEKAFLRLRQHIKNLPNLIQETDTQSTGEEHKSFFKSLYKYRLGLLSAEDRLLLIDNKGDKIAQRSLKAYTNPFSDLGPPQLKSDPFYLFPSFVKSHHQDMDISQDANGNSFLIANDKTWYLFQGKLTNPTFSLKTQEALTSKLAPFFKTLQKENEVEILKTGAIFYAAAGAKSAQEEISFVGGLSLLAIVVFLLLVFRSATPLALGLTVISTGIIAGVSACLLLFGSIHILALVFGCSLVGVAVDYAIHYFCAQYASEKHHPLSTLKSLIPALPLGVLSSALGYGILVILPFPGIQQMAVLASVGLLSSFITVALFGPYIVRNRNLTPPLPAEYIQKGLMNFAALGGVRSVKLILSVLFLSFAGLGIMNIRFEDDVRQFQSLDQDLKQQENRIKSMFKMDSSPKFIAITMATLEKALQLEEKILDKLMGLKGEKASFRGLSQLTPSQKRQEENQILIQEKLFNPHLKTLTQALGATLPSHKTKTDVFSLKTSESDNLPTGWGGLISHTEAGKTTLRLMINGDINPEAVEAIVSSHGNALYVDPAREYSNIFKTYRNIMLYVLLSVLGLVVFILALKETTSIAFKALIPVVIALSTTLGLLGAMGIAVNLFHVMGLMLVLCIGIDYALFLCLHKGSHKGTYLLLANGMAALTTLLSFGLLSFSSTNAVHSFGLSVFMGIILCFCVTTLFLGKKEKQS